MTCYRSWPFIAAESRETRDIRASPCVIPAFLVSIRTCPARRKRVVKACSSSREAQPGALSCA
ncbi:hypothetical protein GVI59_08615 [Acetobacter sicerae]|nr:hypothetical protein [Acetobacter sicerae]